MGSTVQGVGRTVLAGGLLALLVACASTGTKVSCDGKLTPINPPSSKVVAQSTADHPTLGATP
jgi:hypothetical protein